MLALVLLLAAYHVIALAVVCGLFCRHVRRWQEAERQAADIGCVAK